MKLYSDLASWWPLLSSAEDYAEEAAHHWKLLTQYATRPIKTLLELGCGGGNNALHLKQHCRLTCTDVSPHMLGVSRAANPDCEHVEGDMRTLRLGRTFDAVFVHDAVMYLRSESELRDAMTTAFVHCVPGGVVLLVPDYTRETWSPSTDHGGHDGSDRSMRYLEWTWDPDPADTEYVAEMIYAMRVGNEPVRVETDRFRLGLFATATWLRLLTEVGFTASVERCNYEDGDCCSSFLGVRRA